MIVANYTNFRIPANKKFSGTKTTESPIHNSRGNSLELPNFTYNQLQIKRNKLSFGAKLQNCEAFEKRINYALKNLKENDALVLGDSFEKARTHLSNFSASLLTRIFFVKDESINGAFVALKDPYGEYIAVTNLVKSPVAVNDEPIKQFGVFNIEIPLEYPSVKAIVPKTNIYAGNNSFCIDMNQQIELTPDIDKGIKEILIGRKIGEEKASINAYLNAERIKKAVPIEHSKSGRLTLADVGGLKTPINKLKKAILYPMQYLNTYKLNGKATSGAILLSGPSGTGKSYIAEALAGETGAHYIKINGPELEDMYVGNTEKNWREKFEEAKKNKPCLMFIDEGDSQVRERSGADSARHDNKTTTQLLTLMNDLHSNKNGEYDGVFLIMATNNKNFIDSAMLNSHRLSTHIEIGPPENPEECLDIFKIHTQEKSLTDAFNPEEFAKKLFEHKCVGSNIAQIVQDADQYAMERSGIYEQMEKETFDENSSIKIALSPEDFNSALADFTKQKTDTNERKMGLWRN